MDWTLVLVIAIAAIFFLFAGRGRSLVSPKAMAALLQQDPQIIDVRTPEEYRAGHLARTVNIPLAELSRKIGRHAPDKDRPILLHCASGARSAAGKKALEQLGYANAHNLGSFGRARSLLGRGP
jgi:phage shock protein E